MIIITFFNTSLVDKTGFVASLFSEVGLRELSQFFFNSLLVFQLMSATYLAELKNVEMSIMLSVLQSAWKPFISLLAHSFICSRVCSTSY